MHFEPLVGRAAVRVHYLYQIEDKCCMCGVTVPLWEGGPNYAIPMFEGRLVPDDWEGPWAGFTACRSCFMQHCYRSEEMGRPAPKFWWDFVGNECHVLVQSDWPGGEALAIFKALPGEKCRDAQIEQAEALIADYTAGRKTPPWGVRAA